MHLINVIPTLIIKRDDKVINEMLSGYKIRINHNFDDIWKS